MTYNILVGTLNPTHSLTCSLTRSFNLGQTDGQTMAINA